MPSRLIREGLLDSDQIHAAGALAEVLFVRLLLVIDDYGRFDGRVSVIRSRCWPLGGPDEKDVFDRLIKLYEVRLAIPYEVDGKPFFCIPNFNQRLRAKRSKYPEPPEGYQQVVHTSRLTLVSHMPVIRPPESESDTETDAEEKHRLNGCLEHEAPCASANGCEAITLNEAKAEPDPETPAAKLAFVCIANNVRATSMHPLVIDWVRDGVTVDRLKLAIQEARMHKPAPEPIPAAYLDKVLASMRKPKVDDSWTRDDSKAEKLCRELGIPGAKIREERDAWHSRIRVALRGRAGGAAAQ